MPYYRLDDDGNVYMQVLDAGIQDDRFEKGNDVNIRFLRVDLKALMNGENPDPVGNTNPADYITIVSVKRHCLRQLNMGRVFNTRCIFSAMNVKSIC